MVDWFTRRNGGVNMLIAGKILLPLERRGCDFFPPDVGISDVGNYRVCTPSECVRGKDGRTYFLEFSLWRYRSMHRLHVSTQYTDNNGLTWGNSRLNAALVADFPPYTIAAIIDAVNAVSVDHYDGILWVDNGGVCYGK